MTYEVVVAAAHRVALALVQKFEADRDKARANASA